MTAAFSTSRYDGLLIKGMKGSDSELIYYDYENVLSFDNVRDSVSQRNNCLMKGQKGFGDDRQIEKSCDIFRI